MVSTGRLGTFAIGRRRRFALASAWLYCACSGCHSHNSSRSIRELSEPWIRNRPTRLWRRGTSGRQRQRQHCCERVDCLRKISRLPMGERHHHPISIAHGLVGERAISVSGDGAVAVGTYNVPTSSSTRALAVRWAQGGFSAPIFLPISAGQQATSAATATNSDGTVIDAGQRPLVAQRTQRVERQQLEANS